MGIPHGFDDKTKGVLFFEIARILEHKRPRAFLLENVKHLKSHAKGRTFTVITDTLNDLGYTIFHKIIDARHYVPQHRERIFIVGFRDPDITFSFPEFPPGPRPVLKTILDDHVDSKYTLSDHMWQYLQDYAAKHRARGNGFGYGLCTLNDVARTLSARYYKDGSEILIKTSMGNPRRLTPRECSRLMGFPGDFIIPVSDTQAYKQFGNSVVIPVVTAIAGEIMKSLLAK